MTDFKQLFEKSKLFERADDRIKQGIKLWKNKKRASRIKLRIRSKKKRKRLYNSIIYYTRIKKPITFHVITIKYEKQ